MSALSGALHAEWTKLRTLASTTWLLLGLVVLTVAVSVASVAATRCQSGAVCQGDPAKLSLARIHLGQTAVAILAVLAISSEYSTRFRWLGRGAPGGPRASGPASGLV